MSTPESRPLLVFDGGCGFCTASVQWLERRLRAPVAAVPWQRADLGELGLTVAEVRRYVWWLEPGHRLRGHHAVGRALRACRPPWPLIGRVIGSRLASPLAAPGYWLVSRIRHRLPGTRPACDTEGGCGT